jgi:hypothetical protein
MAKQTKNLKRGGGMVSRAGSRYFEAPHLDSVNQPKSIKNGEMDLLG